MNDTTEKREKACGIDVHKNILVATVLDSQGKHTTQNYFNTISGIQALKKWIINENCDVVAFESTGVYWCPLHESLFNSVTVEVANAYHIKHVPGKKTDTLDSLWIAQLSLNRQISPSRILTGKDRDFRSIVRYRESLVEERTTLKNQVHKILDSSNISLSNVLTDIFGKSGLLILNAIAYGKPLFEIVKLLPRTIQKKAELIQEIISTSLSDFALIQLRSCLRTLDAINREIEEIEEVIGEYVHENFFDEYKILCSIPGIAARSASIILAEIKDIHDFLTPANLVSWTGLNPTVYQSAGTIRTGSISKQGNTHLRWILVECAHSCARQKGTHLYQFFERVKKRVGYKKAIVALARKILVLIWHLLMNNEVFEDDGYQKTGEISIPGFLKLVKKIGTEEAVKLIQMAHEIDRGGSNGLANI